MYEAELVQIYDEVFAKLGLPVEIKINNRKVLTGIAEVAGIADRFVEMTVAIDKLDKIGVEGVRKELSERGISDDAVQSVESILKVENLEQLKPLFRDSEIGKKGTAELEEVFEFLKDAKLTNRLVFDITLARGLSYYTGCIFEVKGTQTQMGSLGGGGRYDDLTGVFGMPGVSGVGVSFGAERIFDVMEELHLFPKDNPENLKLLFVAFDEASHKYAFRCLTEVRAAGINADLYPKPAKMNKQMNYANDRKVPFVVIIGSNEMESGKLALKNMVSGSQELLPLQEIIEQLKKVEYRIINKE
jgi:histidyl-tRNA synthetase